MNTRTAVWGTAGVALLLIPLLACSKEQGAGGLKASQMVAQIGSDGKVVLSTFDEELLRKTYDRYPGQVWLVFNSKVREVALTAERDDWDDRQKQDPEPCVWGAESPQSGQARDLGKEALGATRRQHSPNLP